MKKGALRSTINKKGKNKNVFIKFTGEDSDWEKVGLCGGLIMHGAFALL